MVVNDTEATIGDLSEPMTIWALQPTSATGRPPVCVGHSLAHLKSNPELMRVIAGVGLDGGGYPRDSRADQTELVLILVGNRTHGKDMDLPIAEVELISSANTLSNRSPHWAYFQLSLLQR